MHVHAYAKENSRPPRSSHPPPSPKRRSWRPYRPSSRSGCSARSARRRRRSGSRAASSTAVSATSVRPSSPAASSTTSCPAGPRGDEDDLRALLPVPRGDLRRSGGRPGPRRAGERDPDGLHVGVFPRDSRAEGRGDRAGVPRPGHQGTPVRTGHRCRRGAGEFQGAVRGGLPPGVHRFAGHDLRPVLHLRRHGLRRCLKQPGGPVRRGEDRGGPGAGVAPAPGASAGARRDLHPHRLPQLRGADGVRPRLAPGGLRRLWQFLPAAAGRAGASGRGAHPGGAEDGALPAVLADPRRGGRGDAEDPGRCDQGGQSDQGAAARRRPGRVPLLGAGLQDRFPPLPATGQPGDPRSAA